MAAQLKVINSFTNKLFDRKEVELTITHNKQATPTKEVIRKELSTNYSIPANQIYVFDLKTRFGSFVTVAKAHMYTNESIMREVVLPYVLRKVTGEEVTKVPRRQRKDARKKKGKIFGTMKRNISKAEKRNKD